MLALDVVVPDNHEEHQGCAAEVWPTHRQWHVLVCNTSARAGLSALPRKKRMVTTPLPVSRKALHALTSGPLHKARRFQSKRTEPHHIRNQPGIH
jgi:hypothetical protein